MLRDERFVEVFIVSSVFGRFHTGNPFSFFFPVVLSLCRRNIFRRHLVVVMSILMPRNILRRIPPKISASRRRRRRERGRRKTKLHRRNTQRSSEITTTTVIRMIFRPTVLRQTIQKLWMSLPRPSHLSGRRMDLDRGSGNTVSSRAGSVTCCRVHPESRPCVPSPGAGDTLPVCLVRSPRLLWLQPRIPPIPLCPPNSSSSSSDRSSNRKRRNRDHQRFEERKPDQGRSAG